MKLRILRMLCTGLLAGNAGADQVRVTVRVIDVPHRELTKWMEDPAVQGRELHDKAVKLALAGGAEIVETNVLTVRSGKTAELVSIAEIIYPTEMEAPVLSPNQPTGGIMLSPQFPITLRPASFTSFETRNTGVTLEVAPTLSGAGKPVDLRCSFDLIDLGQMAIFTEHRDEWGDASVRMPVFESKKIGGSLTLADGVFELFNVFTPKPAAIPAPATRMLVFVRTDVLPIPVDE